MSNRAGNPAAPRGTYLPLLPLGPDGVRRFLPRRTHPATRVLGYLSWVQVSIFFLTSAAEIKDDH